MATLLLNLRGVPDDEADEIRALLEERKIPFYETAPSRWGVSAGGIWIRDRADAEAAERVLAEYQRKRRARARVEYHAARRSGAGRTIGSAVREDPLRAIAVLLGIVFAVALLALPFLLLGW